MMAALRTLHTEAKETAIQQIQRVAAKIVPPDDYSSSRDPVADAMRASVQTSIDELAVSADDLMGLLVFSLIHAQLPNVNTVLWQIRAFSLDAGESYGYVPLHFHFKSTTKYQRWYSKSTEVGAQNIPTLVVHTSSSTSNFQTPSPNKKINPYAGFGTQLLTIEVSDKVSYERVVPLPILNNSLIGNFV